VVARHADGPGEREDEPRLDQLLDPHQTLRRNRFLALGVGGKEIDEMVAMLMWFILISTECSMELYYVVILHIQKLGSEKKKDLDNMSPINI